MFNHALAHLRLTLHAACRLCTIVLRRIRLGSSVCRPRLRRTPLCAIAVGQDTKVSASEGRKSSFGRVEGDRKGRGVEQRYGIEEKATRRATPSSKTRSKASDSARWEKHAGGENSQSTEPKLDEMVAGRRKAAAKDAGLDEQYFGSADSAEASSTIWMSDGEVESVLDVDVNRAADETEGGRESLSLTKRWRKRVGFVIRTVKIWAFLFNVLVKLARQKLVQRDEERMSQRRRKLGRYLCRAFLKLGPTFIKIGQVTCLLTPIQQCLRRRQPLACSESTVPTRRSCGADWMRNWP